MEPEEIQETPSEEGFTPRGPWDPLADMPEDGYRFRNHPQVILDNVIGTVFVMGVIWLFNGSNMGEFLRGFLVVLGLLVAVAMAYSYLIWKRTVFIFTREEIQVSRVALSKTEKRIRYDRLASVGVNRSITNRLLGTSTLTFNVNSSVNALTAEARLVLRKDQADRLRDSLNSMIFKKEFSLQAEAVQMESMIHISNGDIILHSFLAQPTAQAVWGVIMMVYAVVSLFTDNQGGLMLAVIMLAVGEAIPMATQILKYFNYRIFRVGDTITVESGMLTTRRSSFKVNKINSVRMRAPLLARVFGKAVLEAEVVGLADQDKDNVPLLCPLKSRREVEGLMSQLVPELVFASEPVRQPRAAIPPMVVTDIIGAAVVMAVFGAIIYFAEAELVVLGGFWESIARLVEVCAMVLAPILIFGHSGLAQKHRSYAMGRDSFLFVYGAYDLNSEFINYDKVQHVSVSAGPVQRMFGVARCSVYLMSSAGFKQIDSGIFEPEGLNAVADEVMARIRDGRYDHRKYY